MIQGQHSRRTLRFVSWLVVGVGRWVHRDGKLEKFSGDLGMLLNLDQTLTLFFFSEKFV